VAGEVAGMRVHAAAVRRCQARQSEWRASPMHASITAGGSNVEKF